MNFKKIAVVLTLMLCMLPFCVSAKTLEFTLNKNVATIKDNGVKNTVTLENEIFTENDRTMVPIRIISEEMGADVLWSDNSQMVTISDEQSKIQIFVGDNMAYINGTPVPMDAVPIELNDRVMVPIRFISEHLGYTVKYDDITEKVMITNNPIVFSVNSIPVTLDAYEIAYSALGYNTGLTGETLLDYTTDYLKGIYAVSEYAIKNGTEISEEEANTIKNEVALSLDELEYSDILKRSMLVEKFVKTLGSVDDITFEDIEKYYNDNYICAKHILIAGDEKNAENKIKEIKKKITNGVDFDKLMKNYSEDPGKETYPDGYVFSEGEMVDEFYTGAKELKENEVSDIVKSSYGYHIIKRLPLPDLNENTMLSVIGTMSGKNAENAYYDIVNKCDFSVNYSNETLEKLLGK